MNIQDNTSFDNKFRLCLSSPLTWKPHRHCTFWTATHDNIKPNFGEAQVDPDTGETFYPKQFDEATNIFRKNLDADAKKQKIWPEKKWKEVVGDDFLAKYEKFAGKDVAKNFRTKSFVSLSKLVKDTHSHNEVGWHPEYNWIRWVKEGNMLKQTFDQFKFSDFWISRFPLLSPFLWDAFKSRRDQLPYFYQGTTRFSEEDIIMFTPLKFVNFLQEACEEQMKAGFMAGRFEKSTKTVEFRPLDPYLLGWVLDGSDETQILVKENTLCVNWDNNTDQFTYKLVPEDGVNMEVCMYIFTHNYNDNIIENCFCKAEKVIVFMAPFAVKIAATECAKSLKYRALPITCDETGDKPQVDLDIGAGKSASN